MQVPDQDCSVIVLTKDNPVELCRTLDSLSIQKFSISCEIILVESWSNLSAFLSLIDRYRNILSHFQIVIFRVMPPAGIYASMNFALSVFNGRTVTFLNSGDSYRSSNSLHVLYSCWFQLIADQCQLAKPKAIFGQARINSYSGYLQWNTPFFKSINTRRWLRLSWPCHQAVLFDGAWAKSNPYNRDQGLSADRAVMLNALSDSGDHCFCGHAIVNYSLSGISSRPPSLESLLSAKYSQSVFDRFRLLLKLFLAPIWFAYPLFMVFRSVLVGLLSVKFLSLLRSR